MFFSCHCPARTSTNDTKVTRPIVKDIPFFESGNHLLIKIIKTITITIGYNKVSTGTEKVITAFKPRLAIKKPIKVKTVANNL